MPKTVFDTESLILMDRPNALKKYYPTPQEMWYDTTAKFDISDFADATTQRYNSRRLFRRYTALRNSLTEHSKAKLSWNRANRYKIRKKIVLPHPPFDLMPYEDFFWEVPEEFVFYMRGAVAYHNSDYSAAIEHFAKLLELLPHHRKHRSTWATFMLGKCWLKKDPRQAIPFFEQCRAFAEDGFHDPLELAPASIGWQARAEMLSGAYVDALHRYASRDRDCRDSLSTVCSIALSGTEISPELVQDEFSRNLLTAWVLAHPRRKTEGAKWLDALQTLAPKEGVPYADRLAWFYYQQGQMDGAAQWLAVSEEGSPYAQWVQAKLFLRSGRIEEGLALMAELSETFPTGPSWKVKSNYLDPVHNIGPDAPKRNVQEDLGYVLLKTGDYTGAFKVFFSCGSYGNAEFLADRVLTFEELKQVVVQLADDPRLLEQKRGYGKARHSTWRFRHMNEVQYLHFWVARRAALQGDWDSAIEYHVDELESLAREMKTHLKGAEDENIGAQERGKHLFEAGRVVGEYGLDLLSPVSRPVQDVMETIRQGMPPDFERRLEESLRPYPKMHYYKIMASDLMWEAAELLPDNDALCAQALFLGGSYIKLGRVGGDADRFYKALVRRNPNLLIAKQADELRWFPEHFTDVVLYQSVEPPKRPWYGRKRWLAGGIAAMVEPLEFTKWMLLNIPPEPLDAPFDLHHAQ